MIIESHMEWKITILNRWINYKWSIFHSYVRLLGDPHDELETTIEHRRTRGFLPQPRIVPSSMDWSKGKLKPESCRFNPGWWLGHPSEKYEVVNWDDEIPNMWENKKWQPNHQPVFGFLVVPCWVCYTYGLDLQSEMISSTHHQARSAGELGELSPE